MALTRAQKEEQLKELKDKFKKQEASVFLSYRGTSVKDITALRNAMRAEGLEYRVAKKNLIKIAAKDAAGIEIEENFFAGTPFGVVFSYDGQVIACKLSAKFAKELESIEILGGIVNGELVGKEVVMQYALLPTKVELMATFVGLLKAPLANFQSILNSGLSGFARALSEYAKTKEA